VFLNLRTLLWDFFILIYKIQLAIALKVLQNCCHKLYLMVPEAKKKKKKKKKYIYILKIIFLDALRYVYLDLSGMTPCPLV